MLASALLPGCYAGVPDQPEQRPALDGGLPLVAPPDVAAFPNIVALPLGLTFTPLGLVVGDFDGDGDLDLLLTGSDMGGVDSAMLRGHGDGTFAAPMSPGLGGCSAFPIVGSITEDDHDDVLLPGCANNVVVYAGRPNGSVSLWGGPEGTYASISTMAVRDFEGDGDNDLFVLTHLFGEPRIDIALGAEGRGFWQRVVTDFEDVDGFTPTQLALGHFDGDGLVDVMLAEADLDVAWAFGERSGRFVLPMGLGVDVPPRSLHVGDMDGDGLDEVVVVGYSDPSLQILSPDGAGGLDYGTPVDLPGFAPYDVALGDFDGDGDLDVAMVDDTQPAVQWIAGDGAGGLGATQSFALATPAVRIHAGDFDGDGLDDLVVATFADGSVTLLMSTPP
ncbi:MAG: VCBS repeat-containing protein [Myxococcales bacterium]|nr:VCBS repeat-containing protein [Myxococcales bacterium]